MTKKEFDKLKFGDSVFIISFNTIKEYTIVRKLNSEIAEIQSPDRTVSETYKSLFVSKEEAKNSIVKRYDTKVLNNIINNMKKYLYE